MEYKSKCIFADCDYETIPFEDPMYLIGPKGHDKVAICGKHLAEALKWIALKYYEDQKKHINPSDF